MNTSKSEIGERSLSRKIKLASYLLAPTLALAAVINSGAPVAEAANIQLAPRTVTSPSYDEPIAAVEEPALTTISLVNGRATWVSAETNPTLPIVSAEWGILDEIAQRAPKLAQQQPRLGSVSTSLYDVGAVLQDGITNPGTTKAIRFAIKSGQIQPDTKIDDVDVSFPDSTEQVGFALAATSSNLILSQTYQPGDSRWLPRTESIKISGVDFDKNIDVTAVWGDGGLVRKWIIQNGPANRDELRPPRSPLILAFRTNKPQF